jgi:hypothetical protein
MSWAPPPAGPGPESASEREARLAWQQGGSSLLPTPARLADRIVTVMLLAFGALLTIFIGIVAVISVIAAGTSCDPARGCSPGGMIGGGALAVGGAFLIGVATVVLAVAAWLRRRSSWWIAAIGFVLATGCVVGGGVVFAHSVDQTSSRYAQYLPNTERPELPTT